MSHRLALSPPRAVLLGAVLCAAGPLTLAFSDSLVLAILGFSVLSGTGSGIVYATCASTVAKWYPEAAWHPGRLSSRAHSVSAPYRSSRSSPPYLTPSGTVPRCSRASGCACSFIVGACGAFLRDPPTGWWPQDIDPKVWAVDKRVNRSLRPNVHAVRQFPPR